MTCSDMFHIVSSPDSPCPGRLTGEPCLTLGQYTSGEYRKYVSGTPSSITLEFHPGHHVLNVNHYFLASNLDYFTMKSIGLAEVDCVRFRFNLIDINSVQNVRISGMTFRGCRCKIESITNLTLEESSFEGSGSEALYIKRSSATIKLCSFSNNRVGLRSENSLMVIDQSTFVHNVNKYLRVVSGTAAAVRLENREEKTVITNSNFTGNIDTLNGGAGALSVALSIGSLEVYNSTFVSNVGRRGGALAVLGTHRLSLVTVHNCSFINNEAVDSGGALFTDSSISIYQSVFMANRVRPSTQLGDTGKNGGAVYVDGSISTFQSTFINNTVGNGDGGAIYVAGNGGLVSLNQSILSKNRVGTGNGGAVFISGDNSYFVTKQSSLIDNEAHSGRGGAVYSNGLNTNVSITETTFNFNSARQCGALDVNNFQHRSVRFNKTTFTHNAATTSHGGVMCIRNASISVLDSTFSHNTAADDAGVFAVDDSDVTIRRATFDNNTAQVNGGVIATEFVRTILSISQASFTNNRASEDGGVVYVGRKGSQINISESSIGSNSATRGGVILILGSSLEITETDISNNTADVGAVVSACNSDVTVSEQLLTSTDPVNSVCTLFDGDVTSDIAASVYFELNGKAYPNNSIIPLLEVGEDDNALLCKTDLTACCATPPNRLGGFYYPNGVIVPVHKLGQGFYRSQAVQEVRLNRREVGIFPAGEFRCEIPDASGTIQNLFVSLIVMNERL